LSNKEQSKKDHIEVFVNGSPVKIYRGMTVKHALISCDQSLYKAAREGALIVEDENGFRVGLEGSLIEGARISTKQIPTDN
jgi:hypothetical protein